MDDLISMAFEILFLLQTSVHGSRVSKPRSIGRIGIWSPAPAGLKVGRLRFFLDARALLILRDEKLEVPANNRQEI